MILYVFTHSAGSESLGPNTRWFRFGKYLVAEGNEVTIIGSSFFHKYRRRIACKINSPTYSCEQGVRFIHVFGPIYRSSIGRLLNHLVSTILMFFVPPSKMVDINKHEDSPDIVIIASSPHPLVVFPAVYWAKKLKAKFIFESRDLWPELLYEHASISKWNLYAIICSFAVRYAVKHAACVISPKRYEGDYYNLKYSFKKFRWIPNVSSTQADETKKSVRLNKDVTIVYAGTFESIYLVDELIKAALGVGDTNITVKLIGDGPELEKLKMLANNDSRIKFLGWLSGIEYHEELAKSDLAYFGVKLMSINKWGISSNKLSEYLSYGLPILAHCGNALPDLVENGAALSSSPGNVDSLRDSIRVFVNDSSLRIRMSMRARGFHGKHYDFRKVAHQMLLLLKG